MLTDDERRILRDFKDSGFRYVGSFPPPDILVSLTRRGLLEWHYPRMYSARGETIYQVTEAGRSAGMPVNEPRITASCDWCEETTDEMDLTPLAGGGWDARNIPRKLVRMGWLVDGDKVFCDSECAEKHAARANLQPTS